jgi:hypothetical protein
MRKFFKYQYFYNLDFYSALYFGQDAYVLSNDLFVDYANPQNNTIFETWKQSRLIRFMKLNYIQSASKFNPGAQEKIINKRLIKVKRTFSFCSFRTDITHQCTTA